MFASYSKCVGEILKGFLKNVIIITIIIFTYIVPGTTVNILIIMHLTFTEHLLCSRYYAGYQRSTSELDC